ncbi:MAG: sodium:solute symporter family transporter [Bryobacteraceae bacterium]
MKGFGTLDYVVVVVYLIAIALVGSSFYKRKSTAHEYFLGGRSMWWLPAGISILAADLSAITVMGTPAWHYGHNLELLINSLGYPLMAPIVILVFVPFYAKLNLYTAYEYLEKRFDLNVRLVTSILFQVLRGMHVAIVIYAPSLVINLVTGLPVWQSILFMGLFTTLYTTLGGIKAVIWTDVIQFCTVTLGILLIFGTALAEVPGGMTTAYHTALDAGRLKLLNFSLDPKELTSFWACIIGGFVLCMAPLTTDQAILQRLFTTKSAADCRRSVIVQSVLVIPISLLLAFTGTALFVFYQAHPERLSGLTNTDAVMPFFAVRELPAGVSGLIIACVFAASMAVMSAGINSLTTATTVDIYQRVLRPNESSEHYATAGRIGTVLWGLSMTLVSLSADRLGDLALAYNRVASVISGPLLGIFLLATMTRRATSSGALIGAAFGAAIVGIVLFRTEWSFFYQGPIGVAVTFLGGWAASLLMPPPGADKVQGLVIGAGEPGSTVPAA